MLGAWTIGRASGVGFTAALASLLLWPFWDRHQALQALFALASGVAGLCGISILLITGLDLIFHRRRGDRVLPLRAFDACLGASLCALALVQWNGLAAAAPYVS